MIIKFNQYNNMNESKIVYHGSDRKFDVFDIDKVGSGDGKALGGWGIYFSDSKEVSDRYVTSNGFIKQYIIPDGDYFDLDDILDEYNAKRIITILRHENVDDSNIEEFQTDFIDYIPDITNKQVYEWLSYVLGSEKNASLFIQKLGYIGNTFKDKWDREATNYVLFDVDYIKDYEI